MKPILALALTGALALSFPAFAQTGGSPGASGSTGGLSGSNTPGSEGTTNTGAMKANPGMMKAKPGMTEGRAAATNRTNTPGEKANNLNPDTVQGDTMKQDQAK